MPLGVRRLRGLLAVAVKPVVGKRHSDKVAVATPA